jgi:XisI protein
MDKVKKYQKIILGILQPYTQVRYANLKAENQLIADKENHRYQIITIGWDEKGKFVHDCPLHLAIINQKIWVQRNMTELDLGTMLNKQGVPNQDIVLGFLSPKMREYTDYAVA